MMLAILLGLVTMFVFILFLVVFVFRLFVMVIVFLVFVIVVIMVIIVIMRPVVILFAIFVIVSVRSIRASVGFITSFVTRIVASIGIVLTFVVPKKINVFSSNEKLSKFLQLNLKFCQYKVSHFCLENCHKNHQNQNSEPLNSSKTTVFQVL